MMSTRLGSRITGERHPMIHLDAGRVTTRHASATRTSDRPVTRVTPHVIHPILEMAAV